jgi:hypothetical protein
MDYTEAERAAIIELSSQLYYEQTGKVLPQYTAPPHELVWQVFQLLTESEQAVTNLLNDCLHS